MTTTIFLAGIIQGSQPGKAIHSQTYRRQLKGLLEHTIPDAEVYCPFENHPESVSYDHDRGKQVFLDLLNRAADADVVIAFVPQASMGTAIEIWRAYKNDRLVVTISPLAENWVIKFFSTRNFETLDAFETFARNGGLETLIDDHLKR